VLVRDRRAAQVAPDGHGATMRAAARQLVAAVRDLPEHPALLWFLVGNFCLVDVLNTAVFFFVDFTIEVFRAQAEAGALTLFGQTFSADKDLESFRIVAGLGLNGLALVYGISIGGWTDRSPLRVMQASAVALLLALIGGAAFGGVSALGYLATLVGLGAFGLTGIWTAGRKIIVILAPADRIGEYFGLYGITVKLSVVGAVVYGVVADGFGVKAGMLAQSLQLLLGLGCLLMVRLPAPGADPR
jgi:UMF1 family MFS transporter